MKKTHWKRRGAESLRKVSVVLLLAYLAIGAWSADSSMLCFGGDGHEASEFGPAHATCCAVQPVVPVPAGSRSSAGKHPHGARHVSCRHISMVALIVSLPVDAFSPGDSKWSHIAVPSGISSDGPWSTAPPVSSVSGSPGSPDPIGTLAHTFLVLLI